MMEFAVFFLIPFDENTPAGHGDAVVEHVKDTKKQAENDVLEEYRKIAPEGKGASKVWAQSRIDFDTRVIGVSLRLPIEQAAVHHAVAAVIHDDYLYWDFDELRGAMDAMWEAAGKVAEKHLVKPHAVYDDVKYRLY